jgi:succinyl-CoA synthetase beta subunit
LLEKAGIAVARYEISGSKEAAIAVSERLGYPVALKASVSGLTHKNQIGGVRLNLKGVQDVSAAFDSVQAATTKLKSSSPTQVLVQEMIRGSLELYLGGRWDREFGALILFGFGGLFVEDLARVCTRLAPIESWEAEQMIAESGVGRAMRRLGVDQRSGTAPIVDAIVNMSRLVATNRDIDTIEVNPLLFRDDGKPCVAVDVVTLLRN